MTEPALPAASSPRGRRRSFIVNLLIGFVALLFVALLAEPVLRLRYAEPVRKTPPVVHEVMPLLRADPRVGFTWLPGIPADRGVVFHNADIVYEDFATDEFGIWNAPQAIQRRAQGDAVQILGLGDSFMEMAAPIFYRAAAERGRFFYSLAIHRQAPPQYHAFLEDPGIGMKPEAVVVGLFENDFLETQDFERWKASGMDWFAYHSGTWFGPPPIANPVRRFVHAWLRGYEGLANVIRVRLRGERMSVSGPTDAQVARTTEHLAQAATLAKENHIALWLVLIPSKPTARGETTSEGANFDRVAESLSPNVAGVIDLRSTFQKHPDPTSLYYREDGHWNDAGIRLAVGTILDRMGIAANPAEGTVDTP